MCSSWVEKPLFFQGILGVCTCIPFQEHLMKEQGHCPLGVAGKSAHGVTVALLCPLQPSAAPVQARARRWTFRGHG